MVYRGHIQGGRVVLDDTVDLPEGAEVEVTVRSNGQSEADSQPRKDSPATALSIQEELDRIWGDVPDEEWDKLPADLTDHLDHYIYGIDKR